jgi:acetate kinase
MNYWLTGLPQVACYDTLFHNSLPQFVKEYPLPSKYLGTGLLKYGFHGLSYEYIMQTLGKSMPGIKNKRIVIAHLGNGASMTAVKNGESVDTTMGLTPLGGLVMSTRPGDMDPGVLLFLLKQNQCTADELDEVLNKESGLKAIAGTGDMRQLLKNEATDSRAGQAIATFCYTAKKFIGAYSAALGGLDLLVFTGGIGENSATIRERICNGMDFLGVQVDRNLNATDARVISPRNSKVKTMVIKTDEEKMIAQHTRMIINIKNEKL